MDNESTELMLSSRNWLGHAAPIITHKVTADPAQNEPATLETRTLLFFDGVSLGKLNVREDVRTLITWKHYGKLSLGDPKAKVKVPGKFKYAAYSLSSLLGFGVPLFLHDLYGGLQEVRDTHKGQTEVVKHDWNLTFNVQNRYPALRNECVGTGSFEAVKYSPRSIASRKRIEQFERETGLDVVALAENASMDAKNVHFLSVNVSY